MPPEPPWTIGRLLQWTTAYLQRKGVESAPLDTALLLAHALGCRRLDLYTRYEDVPDDTVRQRFRELVRQRVEGCPVAYLVGRKEFFSLEFEVDRAVLIPRPDTEWLVSECLRLAKDVAAPRVLDVGTGSGCLAVAVALRHRGAQVAAIDLSEEALAVARRNADRHGAANRVRFLHGDLFAPLDESEAFDFILSNPPYIVHDEIATLAPGVRDFEPHLALDGGPDGFAVFDRLVAAAPRHLAPGGWLLLEIGAAQEAGGKARLEAVGAYEPATTVRDLEGRPRVLRTRKR